MTTIRAVVAALAVLALDAATKVYFDTPQWALHHRSERWQFSLILMYLLLVPILLFPPTRVAGAVLGAATTANLVDSLNGSIRNPFVVSKGGAFTAFNVADIALYVGALLLIPGFMLLVGTVIHGRRRPKEEPDGAH